MVLIDGVVFTNNRQLGIQRYFFEILTRLATCRELRILLDDPQAAALPANCETIVRHERFWTRKTQFPLWAWRQLRRKLLATTLPQASVFHTSYFTRSPIRGIPEISTVYDMIFERAPYYYGPASEADALQKAASIRAAARIITISQSTADELTAFYPETRERVVTVYPGAEHLCQLPSSGPTDREQKPYCLFVGQRFAYKNFTTLVDAMTLGGWDKELELHVVGMPFLHTERMLIKRLGLEGRIRDCGPLSDAALVRKYHNCAAFIFPSLAEGFGLPILEAQSCGAPLACSDIPVFREIAGTAAEFFDPLDPTSVLAATMRCVNTANRDKLSEAQRRNLQRFSWDRCAQQTLAVWDSVVP
jgi:glycosyltransferase involved in cell wall biosynthesis